MVSEEAGESPFFATSWSADGRLIAGVRGDITRETGVTTYSVQDRSYRNITPIRPAEGSFRVRWTPDGTAVVTSRGPELLLLDIETGEETVLHSLPAGSSIGDFSFSSDGSEIFYVHSSQQADLWVATLNE